MMVLAMEVFGNGAYLLKVDQGAKMLLLKELNINKKAGLRPVR